MLKKFIDIYEPSGVSQLENGQVIVVDDDGLKPLSLLKLNDNKPYEQLIKLVDYDFSPYDVSDLEALTIDKNDVIYAITSHSRNAKGKLDSKRNRLIRFSIRHKKIEKTAIIDNLREWIISNYPELKKSSQIKKVQKNGGLNIEGLAVDSSQRTLLIGLRSPLNNKKESLVIPLTLNKRAFKNKSFKGKPKKLISLDLAGAGIRDLTYVPHFKAFLILSGTSSNSKKSAQIWLWKKGQSPIRMKIKGNKKLATANGPIEGITPIKLKNNKAGILLVVDDGNQKKSKVGHYLFIPYKNLTA